jgi:hypothetical protein
VDDFVGRSSAVIEYAMSKCINLKKYCCSKKKTYPDTKYCYANAMNTGAQYADGDIILFIQDYMWLPPNVLSIISSLYELKKELMLLSFQEILYDMPRPRCDHPLYLLGYELDRPINEMGLTIWQDVNPDVFPRSSNPDVSISLIKCDFWECYCSAINTSLFRYLNGFNEKMDYGNDCNEKDIMYRAKILGIDNYLVNVPVWQINHHLWGEDKFMRSKDDSNLGMFADYIKGILEGNISLIHKNNITLQDNYIGHLHPCDHILTPIGQTKEYEHELYILLRDDLLMSDEYIEIGDSLGEYPIKLREDELYKRVHVYNRLPWIAQLCCLNMANNRVKCGSSLFNKKNIHVPVLINKPETPSQLIDNCVKRDDCLEIFSDKAVIKINCDVMETLMLLETFLRNDNHILYIRYDRSIFATVFEFVNMIGYKNFNMDNGFIRISKN